MEDDAVIRDRERGIFTDPTKVHHIGHDGAHFKVPGIHLSEPSPQRTPVIYQAGSSPRGCASPRRTPRPSSPRPHQGAAARDGDDHPPRARDRRPRPVRGENLQPLDRDHRRHRRRGACQTRRVPVLRRCRGCADVHVRLDGRRPGALRARRTGRQRRLQRDPVGGRGVPVRRPRRPRVGGPGHRRVGQDRRDGPAHRGFRCGRGRYAAGVGRGDRRRRIQPRIRRHAGFVRRLRRPRRAGADRARGLPVVVCPGHAAQQTARPRRPAARGASRRPLPCGGPASTIIDRPRRCRRQRRRWPRSRRAAVRSYS